MKITGLKCPYCGAEIAVKANRKYVKCEYCKSSLYIDHDTVRFAADDENEAVIPATKGVEEESDKPMPDQKPDEKPEKKKGSAEKEKEYETKVRTVSPPKYNTVSTTPSSSRKKEKIGIGTILLWIIFFPFMLTIWLLRRKKAPVLLRWLAVILLWGVLIWLGRDYYNRNKREIDLYKLTFPAFEHYLKEDDADQKQTEPATEVKTERETQAATQSSAAVPATEKQTEKKEEGRRATYLNGRGKADSGRETPHYVGVIGYAVTGYTENLILERKDSCFDTPWQVPVYEKDKQFFNQTGTIDHKTEVLVLSQDLKHEGYGRYSGYLTVREIATGREFLLNVANFITKPYWEYDDLIEAVKIGNFLAEYHPVSDYYPVTRDNEKVELDDGFKVLVRGLTGTYGKGGPDRNITQLECVVFKEWKYGYGDVIVFFNKDDLKLIY